MVKLFQSHYWLIVFVIIGLAVFQPTQSSDFGWHMRTGEIIVTTGQIPRTDQYSFTFPGYEYIYHSWLTEVVIYLTYSNLGMMGISLLYSLLFALAVTLVSYKKPLNLTELLIFGLLFLELSRMVGHRTQTFTFLLLAISYWLTHPQRLNQLNKPFLQLALLPILFLLWANIHPGFLVGLFVVSYNLTIWLIQQNAAFRTYLKIYLIVGLSGLATLINPHTYRLHQFLLQMMTNQTSSRHVFDWLPFMEVPSYDPSYKLLVIILFVATIFLIKNRLADRLLLAIFFLLMLGSARYAMPFTLILTSLLPSVLPQLTNWIKNQTKIYRLILVSLVWVSLTSRLLAFGVNFQASLCANQDMACLEQKMPPLYRIPYQAVEYLKANNLPDNILNDFNWGGYLIWQVPDRKVFIDGRMDNFYLEDGTSFLTVFNTLAGTYQGWQQLLDDYNINTILIRPIFPLVDELRQNSDWQVVFEDDHSIILVREHPIPTTTQ